MVNIFTDSQYVVNGITKGWADKWKLNNWYRTKTAKASNYDLWDKLLNLISIHQNVIFNWVKGHAGHAENERCDQLASLALNSKHLLEDIGYEATNTKDVISNSTNLVQNTQSNKLDLVLGLYF